MSFSKNRHCSGSARLHCLHVCTMLTGTWRNSMAPRQRGWASADTRGLPSLCVAARPRPDGNRFAIDCRNSPALLPLGLIGTIIQKRKAKHTAGTSVLLRWFSTSRGAVLRCLLGRIPLLVSFLGIRTLPRCTLSRTAVRRRGWGGEEVSMCALTWCARWMPLPCNEVHP